MQVSISDDSTSHADSVDSATASMSLSSYAEVLSQDAPRPVQIVVSKSDHTFDLDHEALQVGPSLSLPLPPPLSSLSSSFSSSSSPHHSYCGLLSCPQRRCVLYVGMCCDDLCVRVSSQLCPVPAHGRTHWYTAEPHEPNHTLLSDSRLNTTTQPWQPQCLMVSVRGGLT